MTGIIGSFFTFDSISGWYADLAKPEFSPPNWVFGPVWITLYTMMGISAYLIYKKGFEKKNVAAYIECSVVHTILWFSVSLSGINLHNCSSHHDYIDNSFVLESFEECSSSTGALYALGVFCVSS
jgi:tryptophan-rich sensory protein